MTSCYFAKGHADPLLQKSGRNLRLGSPDNSALPADTFNDEINSFWNADRGR